MNFVVLRNFGFAAALSAALLTTPAMAEDQSAEELARDGIQRLMDAMELFVGSIPMYAAPEVMPNGDIIIRRIQPDEGDHSGSDKESSQEEGSDT